MQLYNLHAFVPNIPLLAVESPTQLKASPTTYKAVDAVEYAVQFLARPPVPTNRP